MSDEEKKGAPAWMISFGDMMTLILTFFILLVSLSKEQSQGLVAKGVGSFLVAIRSFGMPGILSDSDQNDLFNNVRRRFNLPPEEDPTRRTEHFDASNLELLRARAAESLRPHDEINQPAIARFDPGSAELSDSSRRYLDLIAPTIAPGAGQVLLVEGHAPDEDGRPGGDDRRLAFERAKNIARYLVEEHGFGEKSVQPRAWIEEIEPEGPATRTVDARLVIPASDEEQE